MINTPIYCAMLDSKGTNNEYIPAEHLLLLEDKLLKVYSGEIKRLIVSMPPRHGKSHLISEYLPFWWLLNRPNDQIIISSYSLELAEQWAMKSKLHFKDYSYLKNLEVGIDRNNHWTIKNRKGSLTAVGVGGSITGKGANLFIIDDPVKNSDEAFSNVYRDKVYRWYQSTAFNRLEPNGSMIIVMTRWHHDDLVGRILASETSADWHVVDFPAIATNDDVLNRKVGEALFPERYNITELEKIKKSVGSYFFSAMYQQQPVDNEHQIFQKYWWKYYNEGEIKFDNVIQVWDTAFEKGKENDYSVCATWGWNDDNFYLIDLFRDKLQFPELKVASENQYDKHKPNVIYIEDAGSGKSLIQILRRESKLNVRGIAPMDKVVRAHTTTPYIEAGRVFLPKNKSFLDDFLNEHNQFPAGKHDDIVDTTTMAFQVLSKMYKPTRINLERKINNVIDNYKNY